MHPDYAQIVELFGLVPPEMDEAELEAELDGLSRDGEDAILLAEQSMREGDYGKAAEHFRKAIRFGDTEAGPTHVGLAASYEMLDQTPQAYRQYLIALRAKARNPEPYLGLADISRRSGRMRQSIEQLENAIWLEPTNAFYHVKLAEALRDFGFRKKAYSAIQNAVLLTPEDPFVHYWMGDLLLSMKDFEAALAAFRAAIELSPGDDHLYAKASVAFWGAGKANEAIKSIRLASDLAPDKMVYYGLLARFLLETGQREEAKAEQVRVEAMDRYDRDQLDRFLGEAGLTLASR